jgi:hypothetical protein
VRAKELTAVLGLCVALAGCGGGGGAGSGQFAGLSRYDAENDALDAVHQEEGDPSSPAYRKALLLDRSEHGHRPDTGGQAWVVHFRTPAGKRSPLCMLVWSETTAAFQEKYGYGLVRCAGGV